MNPEPHPDPAAGHPARLAVGIIGAGRAGTALGTALARAIEGAGIAVPPGDAGAMADAARALAEAPERRLKLGEGARARAMATWDREAILAGFERDLAALAKELSLG